MEARIIALGREAGIVTHEDFMDAVLKVQAKKKRNLNYVLCIVRRRGRKFFHVSYLS